MKQVFITYTEWEDYQNGMWTILTKEEEQEKLQQAIEFTGNHIAYGKAMMKAITMWPNTCLHNLTDMSINRRAFIGHCAVCLELGIPEYIVRMAWHRLTDRQRTLANIEADKAIKQWEINQQKEKYEQAQIRF